MKAKLTATFVRGLTPSSTPFEVNDTEISGFMLRVQPSGVMTYYIRYRVDGKSQRFRLGLHGTLTAPGAREAALTHLRKLASGVDPQSEKKTSQGKSRTTQSPDVFRVHRALLYGSL